MSTTSEAHAQYYCQRHDKKYYTKESYYVDVIHRKHRHDEFLSKSNEDNRIISIDYYIHARRDQNSFVKQIKDALKRGNAAQARRLAVEGAQRYPGHHDLQEYARLLAPPRIINRNVPSKSSIRANHSWLKMNREKYQGNWVALRDGELIGFAASLDALVHDIGRSKETLLTKA